MKQTFAKTWPLFFGLGLMMIGNGLQGTLLGIRASIENFSVFTTGLIMSSYYFGLLVGSLQVPKLIANVGHIRVFSALASIASTTVLLHGVLIDPIAWIFVRALTGFAYAGLYLVVESWLNNASTNENRGTILGVYMLVTYVGMSIGQALLNLADPGEIQLFVITSVLVSLALLPIALSKRPVPDFTVSETIAISTIWKRSPLGILGIMINGFTTACIYSIAPIFGIEINLNTASISGMMIAFTLGAMVMQMPIAWISDRMDRRKMIILLGIFSTLASSLLFLSDAQHIWILYTSMALLGGFATPIYSQCVSHVNDHLNPKQFVAASGTLLMLNGMAAACGPIIVSTLMQFTSNNAFAVVLWISFVTTAIFGIYRAFTSNPVPLEDQGDTIIMPARGSGIKIYNED